MKKKTCLVILSFALLLTACGGMDRKDNKIEKPSEMLTGEIQQKNTEKEPAKEVNTELAKHPLQKELVYFQEGEETYLTVKLFNGDGYLFYMPEEDWQQDTENLNGVQIDRWTSSFNDSVSLLVCRLENMKLDEVQNWIRQQYPKYDLMEDKQGGLRGQILRSNCMGDCLEARILSGNRDMFAIILLYPSEAAEGFGATMNAIADTVELDT